MLSALFRRKANRAGRANSLPEIPYQIECACGHSLRGNRAKLAVTVKCPQCRGATLVFPLSPLTELRETIRDGIQHRLDKPKPAKPTGPVLWRKPVVAAGIALVAVVAIFFIVLKSSFFREDEKNTPPIGDQSTAVPLAAARQAIADLDYRKAAGHFREASAIARQSTGTDVGPYVKWLEQMDQEARVTADLLDISLEEVLQKAGDLNEKTWKDQFASRYAERSIVFDALVHEVSGSVYRIDYPLAESGKAGRIEIHRPPALQALKTQWPMRMLLAIRLADARRDRGGWLILGKPDGVVILTEPAFFNASTVPIDADLAELLKRQKELLGLSEAR